MVGAISHAHALWGFLPTAVHASLAFRVQARTPATAPTPAPRPRGIDDRSQLTGVMVWGGVVGRQPASAASLFFLRAAGGNFGLWMLILHVRRQITCAAGGAADREGAGGSGRTSSTASRAFPGMLARVRARRLGAPSAAARTRRRATAARATLFGAAF